jgi:hypothetical protein
LGGAVFQRAGTLYLINATFTNDTATGGASGGGTATAGQGKGGALFAMSGATAISLGAAPTFSGNGAANAGTTSANPQDNADAFGTLATDAGATLTVTTGTSQSADVNQPFASAPQVTLTDGSNTPVPNAVLTFSAPKGGAGATLSAQSGVTDANGQASVAATANGTAGSYTVTAGAGTLQAAFDLQNVSPPLPTAPPVVSPPVLPPVPPSPPVSTIARFAIGSASGGLVSVYDNGQPTLVNATPYGAFAGGIAVAVGDVTGDGVPDLAMVVASGGPALVKVFDGVSGTPLLSFFAFPQTYTGGASIALGDVDGTGHDDIIVGSSTGTSAVEVFDGLTGALRASFTAYPEAPVGVHVAAGDLNGTGTDQIITTPTSIAPLVREFTGAGALVGSFLAFSPSIPSAGYTVTAGDLDGSGKAQIVVGTNVGGLDYALVFNADGSLRNVATLPVAPTLRAAGPQLGIVDLHNGGHNALLFSVGPVLGAMDATGTELFGPVVPLPPNFGGAYIG